MARTPDARAEQAKEMFLSGMKLIDISEVLGIPEGTIRSWKNRYNWENRNATLQKSKRNVAKHKGGQPGNKNAIGHGGTGPCKNSNAETHGFFRKYLPEETCSIIEEMPSAPLDILWDNIQISYAAIIRSQQIMYVKDKEDKTIEKIEEKNGNIIGERWEVQQAWDKQANFLQAQARAMKTLESLIKRYNELLHENWELATEEQRTRIAVLKTKLEADKETPINITFTKASDNHG